MMEGIQGKVFDIRRFSIHDGSGIRTTVFFKGCPLHCVWCQNPEGIDNKIQLLHFDNNCIGCGLCAKASQDYGNEDIMMKQGKPLIQHADTMHWKTYIEVCPADALRLDGKSYTVEEIMMILLRDQAFFKYGGGITLSGGEPFYQPEFAFALLKALKASGVHTAVETSLAASGEVIQRCMPYIDTLYADFKIFDSQAHRAAIGMDNHQIKQNISWLLTSQYREKVIIRTPLIPTFTAEQVNIQEIAAFITNLYPKIRYEMLNYNPLAAAKYKYVDFAYCFTAGNPAAYTKEELQAFYDIAKRTGVAELIV